MSELTWNEHFANSVPGLRRAVLVLRRRDWYTHYVTESQPRDLVYYIAPGFLEPFHIVFPGSQFACKRIFDPPRQWDSKSFDPVSADSVRTNYVFIDPVV